MTAFANSSQITHSSSRDIASPTATADFSEHYSPWNLDHLRWQNEGVEYAWHSRINWPAEFEREVHDTFESLMKRHAVLLDEVAAIGAPGSR
jgi:hypothetical protein